MASSTQRWHGCSPSTGGLAPGHAHARDRIAVAVGEAVANAIEHGNGADERRRVGVELQLSRDELTITVRDDGPGVIPAPLPDPRVGERRTARPRPAADDAAHG